MEEHNLSRFSKSVRVAGALAALATATAASAQPAADFNAGKPITLIVGAGEGAAYDLAARVIARRLRDHLPGAPAIVPRNMPGASQIRATEYAFNLAPRDGTALLIAQPSVVLNKVLNPAARYEPREFTWIGRVQPTIGLGVVWRDSPARDFDDARRRDVVFGANSPTGPQAMLPTALNGFAGAKFRVVTGYESEHRALLAMERGEIDGIGNVMSDSLLTPGGWITRGLARPLYAAGLKRLPRLPDVPTVVELANGEEGKAVMRLMVAISELGLNLMAPPGVPPERVATLRRAFDAMMADAAFVEDIGKPGFGVDPMTGEDLAAFVTANFSPSPDFAARFRAATLGP